MVLDLVRVFPHERLQVLDLGLIANVVHDFRTKWKLNVANNASREKGKSLISPAEDRPSGPSRRDGRPIAGFSRRQWAKMPICIAK
jgi:hypothetical protein